MKKILTLTLVVLTLVFALASCGKTPDNSTTTKPTVTEPPVHTHNYADWDIVKNPTCTENGEKVRYCSCGEKQSEVILASGHNPAEAIEENRVEATCTANGSYDEVVYCTNCGTQMSRTTKVIDALGHTESDWIVDVEATTTTVGSKHTECTVCGEKIRTEVIEKTYSQGLEYALNDDGQSYSVTGIGTCTDTDVVIPNTYNGIPVTSISNSAFRDCSSLTSITIPDFVTSIGDSAFEDCSSLTSITIPDSVTSIGGSAFYYCSSLTSITIPDSVTSIGDYAFEYCPSLTSITVDENNEYYKSMDGNLYTKDGKTLIQYAIGKKTTSFTIPDSVTSICDGAFYQCKSLTSIEIPDSVTSIGEYAFSNCSWLTSIEIPDSVTSIGDSAFFNCKSLTSIVIPNSVTSIGGSAFTACTSLTSIVIPVSVTSIGYIAFYGCSSLTIYCEATSKPSGWDSYWNPNNRPVIWGYKPE